jgi:hypothetical protein
VQSNNDSKGMAINHFLLQAKVARIVEVLNTIIGCSSVRTYNDFLVGAYRFPITDPVDVLKNMGFAIDESVTANKDDSILVMTLKMRESLMKLLAEQEANREQRNRIAKWIVADWGGIKSGKLGPDGSDSATSLIAAIDKAEDDSKHGKDKFDFNRIASWSKFLAFKSPEEFAIYDARVIYSLNWLLYQCDAEKYLPMPTGQNSVMGLLNYEVFLFLKSGVAGDAVAALQSDVDKRRGKDNAKSSFVRNLKKGEGGPFIDNKAAYSQYCGLLEEMARLIFGAADTQRLTKTEMLLFSIADAEIAKSVLKYLSELVPTR